MCHPVEDSLLCTCPSGWLAPNGDYYPCNWGHHASEARKIQKAGIAPPHPSLITQGWLEISLGKIELEEWNDQPPTQAQIDKLHDLLPALASYLGHDSQAVLSLAESLRELLQLHVTSK